MIKEERENIKEKYPSICYNCYFSRKPASDENRDKGYVGCCIRALEQHQFKGGRIRDYEIINEAKEVAEGWVDLRSSVFGEKSGIITDMMLLTKEVKSCDMYEFKERKYE